MFKIHTSKFRHVFCDAPKTEETFTGFRLSTATGDQQYIKASAKYWVIGAAGGGGPMVVGRHDRPGRFEPGTSPIVQGHSGSVLDMDFNPFNDSMFASASEDTTIKIWTIPEDWEPTDDAGNAKAGADIREPTVDLHGHRKKVTLLNFHPTASNILLSSSGDYQIKVWDVEKGQALHTYKELTNLAQDIVWDYKGDIYSTSSKDKAVRFVDGRSGQEAMNIEKCHEGTKSMKLNFLGDSGKFMSAGASKTASREVKIWDLRDLAKPLHTEKIDNASGALLPLYDADTKVIYLAGKGDGVLRIYEYTEKAPHFVKLNDGFRSTTSTKGACLVPKRGLNIMKHETARVLKVTNNQGIHPLSFFVPRKSEAFQDDIFPDCAAPIAAMTSDEWMAGTSKTPMKMSLDPADKGKTSGGSSDGAAKPAFKSIPVLTKELAEATKKIEELQGKINGGGGGGGPSPEEAAKAAETAKELEAAQAKLKQADDKAAALEAKVAELSAAAETTPAVDEESKKKIESLEESLQAADQKAAALEEESKKKIESLEESLQAADQKTAELEAALNEASSEPATQPDEEMTKRIEYLEQKLQEAGIEF